MKIRLAEKKDIPVIMKIYDIARLYMRQTGNTKQWIGGYPQQSILEEDIKKQASFICVEGDKILASFCFSTEIEKTYNKIYEGAWLNNSEYAVIHRLAVSEQKKGIASFCLDWCFQKMPNIKIDTHRDNIPMQNLLKKHNYKYCGIIYLQSGDERLAFQKID